ncbi:metallophosphoesterase [Haloferula rosea]|uniref:Metallophosphoesterase n=2 Tax=Haloferula rosea TaxID=490093 RepID=A0A934REK4_9BACT|nr:metallophosphoesterase [Haloferula rosea]
MALGTGLLPAATRAANPKATPALTIGLLTDVHYADKPARGSRFYRDSLGKAEVAAEFFKRMKPDLVLCLGDLIDAAPSLEEEISDLKTISEVIDRSGRPRRHVLGNHCVHTLTKAEFFKHAALSQTTGHFSEVIGGTRIVVLDACFTGDMEPYQRKNFEWTDTNIPEGQLKWLESELKASKEPAVVFIHQRIDRPPSDHHTVNQSPRVRQILERSGKVSAVFQGHSHQNDLTTLNGIDYCTLAAMVEGQGSEKNAYSLLEIHSDGSMTLKGYHQQVGREFGE